MPDGKSHPGVASHGRNVLLLAAITVEIDKVIFRLGQAKRQGLAGSFQHSTQSIRWAVTGMGGPRMQEAARRAIAMQRPDHVMLVGFAGGLTPELRIGDARQITTVLSAGRDIAYHLHTFDGCNLPTATLLTVDELACTIPQKQALREAHQADLVDMETWYLAGLCAAEGLPLTAIRVVSDGADHALPGWLPDLTNPDGTPNLRKAVTLGLIHLPVLLQLAISTKLTTQALADAVERMLASNFTQTR